MKKYLLLTLFGAAISASILSGCDSIFPPDVSPKPPDVSPTIAPTPTGGTHSLTWTNQIKLKDVNFVRDAYIFSANGNWYMTGTRQITSVSEATDPEGAWPGFFLWKSMDNMNTWTAVGWILKNTTDEATDDIKWSRLKLWAPEIKRNPNNGKSFQYRDKILFIRLWCNSFFSGTTQTFTNSCYSNF